MALGKNIEHLRALSRLTRVALATAIGKSNDQPIYALETRDSKRSDMAPALAKFFGVDLEVLITQDLTNVTLDEARALRSAPADQTNSTRFACATIPTMKTKSSGQRISTQMQRLYQAAKELRQVDGKSAVARLLNLSPQNLNHWEDGRPISSEALLRAQEILGCDALWIRDGVGNMLCGGGPQAANLEGAGEVLADGAPKMICADAVSPMTTISGRISEILGDMDGPDRGKQTRLAEIAGCSKGLINQLLTTPSQKLGYDYAKNIENALGYRVDWILYGKPPKTARALVLRSVVRGQVGAQEAAMLLELFGQSTANGRRFIMEAATLAEKFAVAEYIPPMVGGQEIKTIGQRLEEAMKERFNQTELAKASGVPQATISRVLKGGGTKGPEGETMRKLARACEVPFEWLNEGTGASREP